MSSIKSAVFGAVYSAIWEAASRKGADGDDGLLSVASITDSSDTTGTNHTVSLPGTVAGQLLLVLTESRANVAIGWPAGYTEFLAEGAASSIVDFAAAYRVADGGEGASIVVTTSLSRSTATMVFLINNHNAGTNAPDGAQAVSTGFNPPSLDPSWADAENPDAFGDRVGSNRLSATMAVQGADEASTLWIAWAGWDSSAGTDAGSAPPNYEDFHKINDGSGGNAAMCVATRLL